MKRMILGGLLGALLIFVAAFSNITRSNASATRLAAAPPTPQLVKIPMADVLMHLYASSNRHGTAMFSFPDLIPMMMQWLDSYNVS